MSSPHELEVIAQDRFITIAEKVRGGGIDSETALNQYQSDIFAIARDKSRRDIASMPWLPQLPEEWAQESYQRIEAKENELVGGDYENGTAITEHEIREVRGDSEGAFVFTAEHATRPVRKNEGYKRAMADVGTGGLAGVLGEDYGRALIAVGRQTRLIQEDPDHEMNQRLEPFIPNLDGFVAVHGLGSGKFAEFSDRTEIQAIIGLGANPSEFQREHAERVVGAAAEIGLKAIIGNDTPFYVQTDRSHKLKRNGDGSPYTHQLYAKRPNSTTNFVQNGLAVCNRLKPAYQIELTRFLRYVPEDEDDRDKVSREIGVALGLKLMRRAVEIAQTGIN